MFNHHAPHHFALRALIVALCLPIVLFMFFAIRTRQLQSTANPRWSQFAKFTGPQTPVVPVSTLSKSPPLPTIAPTDAPVIATVEPFISESATVETLPIVETPAVAPTHPLQQSELHEIHQRLTEMTRLQSELLVESTQRGQQLVQQLNQICQFLAQLTIPKPAAVEVAKAAGPEINCPDKLNPDELPVELPATFVHFTSETVQDAELHQFLNQCGELAKTQILSMPQTPSKAPVKVEKVHQVPLTLQRARLERTLNEPKYYLRREGNLTLICTTDEAIHIKPEQWNRVLRANWPNDPYGADLNQLLELIVKGLVNFSDQPFGGESAESITRGRSTISISRRALARAYFECAAVSWQKGEVFKARQQLEASLRQNRNDVDAIRLRNEIDQATTQNQLP